MTLSLARAFVLSVLLQTVANLTPLNSPLESLESTNLEARDCWTLYRQMIRFSKSVAHPFYNYLEHWRFVPEFPKHTDVVAWGKGLKKNLAEWIEKPYPFHPFDDMRTRLRDNGFAELVSAGREPLDYTAKPKPGSAEISNDSLFALILHLRSHGGLPALVFNHGWHRCEKMFAELLATLTAAETEFRETKPRTENNADGMGDWDANPNTPLPQFNFADTTKLSRSEFEEIIQGLQQGDVPPRFIRGLHRGLAVHHSGMHYRYRQL